MARWMENTCRVPDDSIAFSFFFFVQLLVDGWRCYDDGTDLPKGLKGKGLLC